MIDLRKETLTLTEARDQLHDGIWPGAQYQLGIPDKSKAKKDLDTGQMLTGALEGYTLNLLEDRMAEIDNEILAALRRDELCIRYERGGAWRYFDADHWRHMENNDALALLSIGRWTVSDNGQPLDLPLKLMQSEFSSFKNHVMVGNPSRLIDLSDALAFIAAGEANEAAAMRWRCELMRVYGRTGWAAPHSEQFELALRELHKSWRAGVALPIAQRPNKPGYDEIVAAELADICELRPYGPGQGKIEFKNVHDRLHEREWISVRFQFDDVARLCLTGDASAGVILAPQKTRGRSLPAQEKADQEARIKQVIAKARRQWPDPKKAPPFQAMAVELCSSDRTGKCVDYSIETTRKILEGRYRPQQRAGISGYID